MSEELEDFIYNAIDHNTRAMPDVKRSLANAIYNKSQAYADEVNKELISSVSLMGQIIFSEDDRELLKQAWNHGRAYGANQSDLNFNAFLQTLKQLDRKPDQTP